MEGTNNHTLGSQRGLARYQGTQSSSSSQRSIQNSHFFAPLRQRSTNRIAYNCIADPRRGCRGSSHFRSKDAINPSREPIEKEIRDYRLEARGISSENIIIDRSIDELSGSDFARARPSRWGARSEAWGRLGGGRGPGANTRAPTPSANNPIKPNFYHLVGHLGQMQFLPLRRSSFPMNPNNPRVC